jgi:hypothetical protein
MGLKGGIDAGDGHFYDETDDCTDDDIPAKKECFMQRFRIPQSGFSDLYENREDLQIGR